MATKPRSRAGMDAETVARMMREQDEPAELPRPEAIPEPPAPPPAPVPEPRMLGPAAISEFDPGKIDGRTLRRTGREPFATRIKPETHEALRRIAYHRRITIAEALELAVAAYSST